MEDFEYKGDDGALLKIDKEKIEKLIKTLKDKIYNEGMYHNLQVNSNYERTELNELRG